MSDKLYRSNPSWKASASSAPSFTRWSRAANSPSLSRLARCRAGQRATLSNFRNAGRRTVRASGLGHSDGRPQPAPIGDTPKTSHSAPDSVDRGPAKVGRSCRCSFLPTAGLLIWPAFRRAPQRWQRLTCSHPNWPRLRPSPTGALTASPLIHRANFDQDEAFVSFFGFCNMVGLTGTDRLSHGDFVRALCAAGLSLGTGRDGRRFHRGSRLVDKFGSVVSAREAAEVGVFIAERCLIGGHSIAERGRSSIIFAAYCRWARERESVPLTISKFGKDLISRGFRRVKSDGHWWQGLRLSDQATSAGTLS